MTDWQTQLEQLRRDPRTPIALTALLGLLLLLSLINFIGTFLHSTPKAKPVHTALVVSHPTNLGELHLFGVYNAVASLPNTALQLTLEGTVVVADDPTQSQALITSPNEPTKVYHVGEALPGNAIITHITPTYVVLNENGTLQKLPLPIETVTSDK